MSCLGHDILVRQHSQSVEAGGCYYFFCFYTFIHFPNSLLTFSFICAAISCLFSPFLWEMTQNDPQGLRCR